MDETNHDVLAECTDCSYTHPVGDRSMSETTTVCPACEGKSYTTVCNGDAPDSETRMRAIVRGISGVGEQTRENIIDSFDAYYELEDASIEQLTSIRGVGDEIAERIRDKV